MFSVELFVIYDISFSTLLGKQPGKGKNKTLTLKEFSLMLLLLNLKNIGNLLLHRGSLKKIVIINAFF